MTGSFQYKQEKKNVIRNSENFISTHADGTFIDGTEFGDMEISDEGILSRDDE